MIGLLALLAVGGGLYWLVLVGWTVHALRKPPRQTYAAAVSRSRAGEPSELDDSREFTTWNLQSQGRGLVAWDIPGDVRDGPVAIVTHGWGSGKVNTLVRVPTLVRLCSRVVLWDQPGHGESRGACSLGVLERQDLLAIIERVGNDRPIVLIGSSMGAGVSIAAASESEDVALVIAEAPYRVPPTPARNVMRRRHAPITLNLLPALSWIGLVSTRRWTGPSLTISPDQPFDRAAIAAGLNCPLVVIHGDLDETCPLEDGREIAEACPKGRFVEIPGGTHQNLWKEEALRATMEREYHDAITALRDA
ncbi:MAG: alpha/beta hydrolase [Phycisphaerales bacterium]|nr:alpha/beta hydrolase [Phycisphaerales bacterium]